MAMEAPAGSVQGSLGFADAGRGLERDSTLVGLSQGTWDKGRVAGPGSVLELTGSSWAETYSRVPRASPSHHELPGASRRGLYAP